MTFEKNRPVCVKKSPAKRRPYYKRILAWALVVLMVLLLTGCAQCIVKVNVQADKSGDVSVILGLNDIAAAMGGGMLDTAKGTFDSAGFEASDYAYGGYSGYQFRRSANDLPAVLNSGVFASFANSLSLTYATESGHDTIKLSGTVDVDKLLKEHGGVTAAQAQASGAELSFQVTFPYPVSEHNASKLSEDGYTAYWNLFGGGELFAKATDGARAGEAGTAANTSFLDGLLNRIKSPELRPILLLVGAAVLLVIIILIIAGIHRRRKKKRLARIQQERASRTRAYSQPPPYTPNTMYAQPPPPPQPYAPHTPQQPYTQQHGFAQPQQQPAQRPSGPMADQQTPKDTAPAKPTRRPPNRVIGPDDE
ncbi:MAG: LppM family (lipo)protein [Christensenellales bacterium]